MTWLRGTFCLILFNLSEFLLEGQNYWYSRREPTVIKHIEHTSLLCSIRLLTLISSEILHWMAPYCLERYVIPLSRRANSALHFDVHVNNNTSQSRIRSLLRSTALNNDPHFWRRAPPMGRNLRRKKLSLMLFVPFVILWGVIWVIAYGVVLPGSFL